jgi:ABC-2 type transport system permease protein
MPQLLAMVAKESNIIIEIPEPTAIDSFLQFFKNLGQMVLFVLIIVFSPLIVDERQNGMFSNLLTNGVKSKNFILAKIGSPKLFSLFFI